MATEQDLTPGAARRNAQAAHVPIEPRQFELDPAAVAAAKETVRRVWRYDAVEAVQFTLDLGPECGETVRSVLLDTDAWFASGVRRIERSLRLLSGDYIPVFESPWAAYFTVPAMLGAELWWEEDPDAWPAVKTPPAKEVQQLYDLEEPDPARVAHIPQSLERLRIAAACLPPEVAIGGMDMMSPFGDVMTLTDQTQFFMALKRDPEAIHHACELVTRACSSPMTWPAC